MSCEDNGTSWFDNGPNGDEDDETYYSDDGSNGELLCEREKFEYTITKVANQDSRVTEVDLHPEVYLSERKLLRMICALENNRHVRKVNFCAFACTPKICRQLDSLFQTNTTIQHVRLPQSSGWDGGIIEIISGVGKSTSVKTLDLTECGLWGHVGGTILKALLERSLSITTLILRDNPLGINGIQHMAKGLQSNACILKNLSVVHCGVDNKCVPCLGRALCHNNVLEELTIGCGGGGTTSRTHITATGVRYLTDLLLTNRSLNALSLSGCQFNRGGKGELTAGRLFARALERNRTLRKLHLERCHVTATDVSCLSGSLATTNQSLTSLDVTCSSFDEAALVALAGYLPRMRGLTVLRLRLPGGISRPALENVLHCLHQNIWLLRVDTAYMAQALPVHRLWKQMSVYVVLRNKMNPLIEGPLPCSARSCSSVDDSNAVATTTGEKRRVEAPPPVSSPLGLWPHLLSWCGGGQHNRGPDQVVRSWLIYHVVSARANDIFACGSGNATIANKKRRSVP